MINDVYLAGNERYIKDFQFLFPDISGQIIDYPIKHLLEKSVILCMHKEQSVIADMAKCGFDYNKNFFFACDFIENWVEYEILHRAKGKKVAIWGAGNTAKTFLPNLGELKIDCIIDSGAETGSNNSLNGIQVVNPDSLGNEFWTNHFIIVASIYYEEISDALKALNLKEFDDYLSYMAFPVELTDRIIEAIEMSPRCTFPCPSAQKTLAMGLDGYLYPCLAVGWSCPIGNVIYDKKNNICNSVIMRAFELSFKNLNNAFCEYDCCDILFNADEYSESKYYKDSLTLPDHIVGAAYDDSCNLFCYSCRNSIEGGKNPRKNYIHEIFKSDILPGSKLLYAAGRGEVFASPYYSDLLKSESISGVEQLLLHSNGVLATEYRIAGLCKRVKSVGIMISVDGAKDETYKKLRRGGDFKKLCDNIEALGKMRVEGRLKGLGLLFVVSKENYKEIVDFTIWADQNHVDSIVFIKLDNWGIWSTDEFREMDMTDENRAPKTELKEEIQKMYALSTKCNKYYDKETLFIRDMLLLLSNR